MSRSYSQSFVLAVAVLAALVTVGEAIGTNPPSGIFMATASTTQNTTINCTLAGGVTSLYNVQSQACGTGFCALQQNSNCTFPFDSNSQYSEYGTWPGKSSALGTYSLIKYRQYRTQAPVSIVFANKTTPTGKIQYWIQTDRFSLLQIDGSFKPFDVMRATEDVHIKVEFAGFSTPALRRVLITNVGENNGVYVVPFWTAVITLDRGVPVGIRWDNTCSGCTSSCIDGACSVPYAQCVDHTSGISCDYKLYVAWDGTDVNGDYMLSAQSTMKNFRSFSARFAYDVGARTYGKVKDRIPNSLPDVPDIPFI